MKREFRIPIIIIGALVVGNAYFFIARFSLSNKAPDPVFHLTQAFILPVNQTSYLPVLNTSAGDVNLDAKSAIVYDVKADRILFEKNSKQRLPVASLTKVLNAIVVWERFSPNDVVLVGPSAVKVDGERQDLYTGETLSVNSLMRLMLVESSNDAAYALQDYAKTKGMDLVAEMNAKAILLDMKDTHFIDPAGLDDAGYSTASDLVKAVTYALRYDAIWNFSREPTATVTSADGQFNHNIKNTNQLLGVVLNIIGGKTGYTDSALGCMILIVDTQGQDDKIVAVVLGSRGRFEDMKNLISWTKHAYSWQ
ncbi:MAG: serine hydrolase [Patescibacteria group bacterium]